MRREFQESRRVRHAFQGPENGAQNAQPDDVHKTAQKMARKWAAGRRISENYGDGAVGRGSGKCAEMGNRSPRLWRCNVFAGDPPITQDFAKIVGSRPTPTTTPFREIIPGNNSPSLGKLRRLGRGYGNYTNVGSH